MAAEYHQNRAPRQRRGAADASLDLDRLSLSPGQGTRLEVGVDPGELELGGTAYDFGGGPVSARIDVSRTATGYALRLRFAGELRGPCVRCLEPAGLAIEVDAREVDQPASADEELLSPYVSEGVLDLTSWAHDALALTLPQQIVCRPGCEGLCPVCGESLNDAPEGAHEHPAAPDPRLAKLRELLD
jgi:uncharacterized protein